MRDEENTIDIEDLDVIVIDGDIHHNLLRLQEQLKNEIEPFKNLEIKNETEVPEAKQVRSNLNKIHKMVNDEKKRVKKEVMAPYTEFEKEVKKMFSEIENAVDNIDTQIKEYENLERLEKWNELEDYILTFNERVPFNLQNLPNILYNPKWMNKTFTVKKAKEDAEQRFDKFMLNLTDLMDEDYTFNDASIEYLNMLENSNDKEKEDIDFQKTAHEAYERIQEEKRKRKQYFEEPTEKNNIVLELKDISDVDYQAVIEFLDELDINYERRK